MPVRLFHPQKITISSLRTWERLASQSGKNNGGSRGILQSSIIGQEFFETLLNNVYFISNHAFPIQFQALNFDDAMKLPLIFVSTVQALVDSRRVIRLQESKCNKRR